MKFCTAMKSYEMIYENIQTNNFCEIFYNFHIIYYTLYIIFNFNSRFRFVFEISLHSLYINKFL